MTFQKINTSKNQFVIKFYWTGFNWSSASREKKSVVSTPARLTLEHQDHPQRLWNSQVQSAILSDIYRSFYIGPA
jgi:hypothetical protein